MMALSETTPAPLAPTARIAVVGAGITGLVAAKTLAERGYHRVYLFEAGPQVGGNGHTAPIALGSATRWADMGVNDYNTKTYHHIYRLICELGADTRPLDDTISYATPDGRTSYTLDGANGTRYPVPEMCGPDGRPTARWARFGADQQYFWQSVYVIATHPHYAGMAVRQYLADPTLPGGEKYAYGPDFVHGFLLPRINGMYFADPAGPLAMPIQLIMHYYVLQEGYNQYGTAPNPDRRYFAQGTRQLYDRLQSWLQYDYEQNAPAAAQADDARAGLYRFNFDCPVQVAARPDGRFRLVRSGPANAAANTTANAAADTSEATAWEPFERVIVTAPAPAARRCLAPLEALGGADRAALFANLAGYRYVASEAVVHTDSRQLPRDAGAWRSFNISIYDYAAGAGNGAVNGAEGGLENGAETTAKTSAEGPYPYTITYVENRHQNDALNLAHRLDPYTGPFFTTLNPRTPVPDRFVLREPGAAGVPGKPLRYAFSHCVPDLQTSARQQQLAQLQHRDALAGAYLAGGYTHGVGLHEECWISGNEAARRAIGEAPPPGLHLHGPTHETETANDTETAHRKPLAAAATPAPDHAPHYLRAALRAR